MEEIVELSSDSNDTIIIPVKEYCDNFYDLSFFEEKELNPKNAYKQTVEEPKEKTLEVFYVDTETNNLLNHIPCTSVSHKVDSVLQNADHLLKELYAKYLPTKAETENNIENKKSLSDEEEKRKTIEIFKADVEGDNFINLIPDRSIPYKADTDEQNSDNLLKELYAKYLPTEIDPVENNGNEIKLLNKHNDNQNEQFKRKISNDMEETGQPDQKVIKKQMLDYQKQKRKLEQQSKKEMVEKEKAMKKTLRNIQKSINPDECLKNIIVKVDDTLVTQFGANILQELKSNGISHKLVKQVATGVISWVRKIQTIENLVAQVQTLDEKHYLLLLPSTEFKFLVQNNNLNTHIHSLSLQLRFQHLTIAVFGHDKLNMEQEYAVMESEMFFKCYWQFVKNIEELSSLIFTITKAVAQIPYKLEKQQNYQLQNEYLADVNRDTVRVDKNGNGLSRLWKQMLTMLPLARLETAEAISSVYPTPSSLFKAYEKCESNKEGLIQNLPIKRANGPLTAARKIGPELSKKCANFFTSTENVFI